MKWEDSEECKNEALSDKDDPQVVDNPKSHSALVWTDKFILET